MNIKERRDGTRGVAGCSPRVTVAVFIAISLVPWHAAAGQSGPFVMFGSSSVSPMGDRLAGAFASMTGSRSVNCTSCDSDYVIHLLANNKCDVGLVIESLAAKSPDKLPEEFETFQLAQYAVAVVVNSRSPVRSMSVEQLGAAFSTAATWASVTDSEDRRRIELYAPLLQRTESYIFGRNVLPPGRWFADALRDRKADPPRQKSFPDEIMGEVIRNAAGIGFVQLGPELIVDKRLRLLQVSRDASSPAVLPNGESLAGGHYAITDRVTLYLHPDAPPVAREFCEFATGPDGAQIVTEFNLWPEYELEKVRGEQRVADVKAGKGEPVAVCDLAGVDEAIRAAALEFAKAKMAVRVTLDSGGGSAEAAVAKLRTGEAELLLVDGGTEEALRGPGMGNGGAEMVLGSRAVGVVVHPGNSFNELTMDDLRQILAGKVDRWPGATGTAERIVLHALPATNPLMPLVDRAMGADLKRAKATVRPDSERVILSVAAQPGALGLVDLTKVARHETKVKLLAILPPGETEAGPPASEIREGDSPNFAAATADRNGTPAPGPRNLGQSPAHLPDDYPLAQPVSVRLSGKASDAAKGFFAFLKDGGGRDALLAGGLIPRPLPEAIEAEVAAAYGMTDGPADEPQATGPSAQVAAAKEDNAPATASPDHLHDVLRGAMGGPQEASPADVVPAGAPAGTERTVEDAATPTTLDPGHPTSRQAEETEAIQPAPGEESVPHGAASEPPADEASFAAWLIAHAVPIGLVGLGVTAVAVAMGSLGMKRARHRSEVMRRYRP